MDKFTVHSGIAVPLLQPNIDTDAIIPSREMKTVSKRGLSSGLFAAWRYLEPTERQPNPDFVLNQPRYDKASILLAGDNFGCGSSREHAVWALAEYGFRAIIAPGFGSIFFNNCIANGIVPIVLRPEQVAALAQATEAAPQQNPITVDLPQLRIDCAALQLNFVLDAQAQQMLTQGLDPIDLTLQRQAAIDSFELRDRQARPWAYQP